MTTLKKLDIKSMFFAINFFFVSPANHLILVDIYKTIVKENYLTVHNLMKIIELQKISFNKLVLFVQN